MIGPSTSSHPAVGGVRNVFRSGFRFLLNHRSPLPSILSSLSHIDFPLRPCFFSLVPGQVFPSFPGSIFIDVHEEYRELRYVSTDVADLKRPKLTSYPAQGRNSTTQGEERVIDLGSLTFCPEPLVPLSGDPWPTFNIAEAFAYEDDPHLAPSIVAKDPDPVIDTTPVKLSIPSPQKNRRRAEPLDQQSSPTTKKRSLKSSAPLAKPLTKRIPRPRNAFMIYRSTFWAQQKIPTGIERDHRHISRIIGHCWNNLPEEEKRTWRTKAEEEKQDHLRKYPGYRYSPITRKDKPIKRNVNRNGERDKQRCKKVAELLLSGTEGLALESAVKELDVSEGDCSSISPQNSPTSSTSSQNPITPLFWSKPLHIDVAQPSSELFFPLQKNPSHDLPTFSWSALTPPEVSFWILDEWWLVLTRPVLGCFPPTHGSRQFWRQLALPAPNIPMRPVLPRYANLPCFPRGYPDISWGRPRPAQPYGLLGELSVGSLHPTQ